MNSIKPCPACKSPYSDCREYPGENCDGYHDDDTARVCCDCGTRGPFKSSPADADAAWNAMPRRGDGLAWRSEPTQAGWWLHHTVSTDRIGLSEYSTREVEMIQLASDRDVRWIGPIPEPPAPDAEKEAK